MSGALVLWRDGTSRPAHSCVALARENSIPIIVFDMHKPGNLRRVVSGEKVGTLVKG